MGKQFDLALLQGGTNRPADGPSSSTSDSTRYQDVEDDNVTASSSAPLLTPPQPHPNASLIDQHLDQPPTYEESSVLDTSTTAPNNATASAAIRYNEHVVIDKDTGGVTSYDPEVNSNPAALYDFLMQQNSIRPQPLVRMRGTHVEKKRKEGSNETSARTVVDFDVRLDFSDYMILQGGSNGHPGVLKTVEPEDRAHRGGIFRTRDRPHCISGRSGAVGLPISERDVRSWVEEYCACTASSKEFVMEKICPGYDINLISRKLHDLISSTNYRGSVHVTFPVLNSKVVIRPSNKFTRVRYFMPLRIFFYITFLWLLSWPILFLITRKYNVVRSVWPMSYNATDGTRQVVLNENDWFNKWRPSIRRALLGRRQGWITDQDLLEVEQENVDRSSRSFQTGSTTADSILTGVVGFLENIRAPEWGHETESWGW